MELLKTPGIYSLFEPTATLRLSSSTLSGKNVNTSSSNLTLASSAHGQSAKLAVGLENNRHIGPVDNLRKITIWHMNASSEFKGQKCEITQSFRKLQFADAQGSNNNAAR